MNNEKNIKRAHEIKIISKELLIATAVNKVEYLSPEAILIDSDMGKIGIKGSGLFVENLNSETGVISLKGAIHSVAYYDKDNKNNFIKRIFK